MSIKNRVGEKYITNEKCTVEIIECFNAFNCTIKFEDGNVLYKVRIGDIKRGEVKNPFLPRIFNVGFIGVGKYFCNVDKTSTVQYKRWHNMLRRAYYDLKNTYKDVTVCEEWHNYQNFAMWYDNNYDSEIMYTWELDKDILFKGNKIYSPETCCFVPKEINQIFPKRDLLRGEFPIGVSKKRNKFVSQLSRNEKNKNIGSYNTPQEAFLAYKTAKEAYIKEVADEWKSLIKDNVYIAMYNYKVEITD